MRTPRLRISILALLAVAGATAAVALASPARRADNRSAVQNAIQKTSKVTSAHFSFTFSVSGGSTASTGAIAVSGAGGFDTKQQASQFKLDLGALASALGAASGGAGAVPQKIDVVTMKTAAYLHIPALAKQVGGAGKEWLKLDLGKLPKSATKGVNPSQVDPKKALATLTAAVAVHKVGSATVRGSSTTHYRATVDIARVVTGLVPKSQQASTLKSMKTSGLKTLVFDIYVDGSGYVRRVAIPLKNIKSKGSPPTSVSISFDLYDFGTSVHVSAPPANKTADGSKLLGSIPGVGGK